MNNRQLYLRFSCLLGVVLLAGCQSLSGKKGLWGRNKDGEIFKTPRKLVAIWSNAVLNQPGSTATRGLGGRLYFYDEGHRPMQVDGDLAVYVYDDSNLSTTSAKAATRKFAFTKEQVASHMSLTEFGPSYSFWIPWDKADGEKAKLSVIPIFTDAKNGQMIAGKQARYLLPGRDPIQLGENHEPIDSAVSSVSTAQYAAAPGDKGGVAYTSAERLVPRPTVTSTTIKLPPSMRRRLSMPVRNRKGVAAANKENRAAVTRQTNSSKAAVDSERQATIESASNVNSVNARQAETSEPAPPQSVRLSPPRRPALVSRFGPLGRDLDRKLRGHAGRSSDLAK